MGVSVEEYLEANGRSPFGEWFAGLGAMAAAKVTVAIDRIGRGNLGEVKSVGGGVSERRVDFGPGYRIYFAALGSRDGLALVLLLGGGSKKQQQPDIRAARLHWKDYKARMRRGEGSWR